MKRTWAFLSAVLIFVFSLAAASCADTSLETPAGFTVDENNALVWTEVPRARSYDIEVTNTSGGGKRTENLRRAYYSLSPLEVGDYEIRVRAVGGSGNELFSPWSETFSFRRNYESGVLFRLINNQTEYEVYKLGSASGNITIEDEYRGKPVTVIAESAFRGRGNSLIESVTVGKNVKVIEASAFYGCTRLASVTLPEGLQTLGASAFQGCSSLKEVELPSGVTALPELAFGYCRALEEVHFGEQTSSIGEKAFYSCSALKKAELPDPVSVIGESAFEGTGITSATIGSGIEQISARAFYDCKALTELHFREMEKEAVIGAQAFGECLELSSVELPEGVTALGEYAFYADTARHPDTYGKLSEVSLPESLVKVGEFAFDGTELYESQLSAGSFIYADDWLVGIPKETKQALETLSPADFKETVVGIADNVFLLEDEENGTHGCPNLQEILFPRSLKYIGEYAFYKSPALYKIEGLDGNSLTEIGGSAFRECDTLANVSLRRGVKVIEARAFYGCDQLYNNPQNASIFVPDSVVRIGTDAFKNSGLWESVSDGVIYAGNWVVGNKGIPGGSVILEEGTAGISDYAFYQCTDIENITRLAQVDNIGKGAFYGCANLAVINLSQDLAKIEAYTFYGCSSLFDVTFPMGLAEIGDYAFYKCARLSELDFADTEATSIGNYTFYGCSNLKSLILPESLLSIGKYTFYKCGELTTLTLPASVKEIGERAFCKCQKLETVLFSDGLVSIGMGAFKDCIALSSLSLPATVKTVGDYAFYKCYGLEKVSLANTEEIGDYAFYGLTRLKTIVIPESVRSIGTLAFKNCATLDSVLLMGQPEWIAPHAFYGCNSLTVYALSGNEIAENWSGLWNSSYRPSAWHCTFADEGYVLSIRTGEMQEVHAWGGYFAPTRAGYIFLGWSTQENATSAEYAANEILNAPADVTLYAVWTLNLSE